MLHSGLLPILPPVSTLSVSAARLHTGTIAVVHWLSSAGGEEDQAGEAQKQRMMAENREGQYVSLVGKINEMENGDRKLTAFSVEAIKGVCVPICPQREKPRGRA